MATWTQLQCRTRVRILLVVIFVLVVVAGIFRWMYYQEQLRLSKYSAAEVRQGLGLLVATFLITTALIAGVWCRLKGMRGFLLGWFGLGTVSDAIFVVAKAYDGPDFPTWMLYSVLVRLTAWLILIISHDIHYYLSYNYDDRLD